MKKKLLFLSIISIVILMGCGQEANKKITEKVEEYKQEREEKRIMSQRPTTFKAHLIFVCNETWRLVEKEKTIQVMANIITPMVIDTNSLKKRITEDQLCKCMSDDILKSAESEDNSQNIFLKMKENGELDKLYTGLSKGTIEELSAENKQTFASVTAFLELMAGSCLAQASQKGN